MEMNHNIAGWFEIPVSDMDRAIRFYETVFEVKMMRQQMGPLDIAFFPVVDKGMGAGGGLVFSAKSYKPSTDGVLIYLTALSGDLSNELERIVKAGGKQLLPKTQISAEVGYMGLFLDTEGNRIALHSRK
jgi:predicted enzyme related to lactoylglutathione lyase